MVNLLTKYQMKPEKTVTAVKVTKTVWREIQSRKDLGESADDVLREALKLPPNEAANTSWSARRAAAPAENT